MGSSSTGTPGIHRDPERHDRSRPVKGTADLQSVGHATAVGAMAECTCERRITGLIVAACCLVASPAKARSVRIVVPCHLTTTQLVRLHEGARQGHARLDVASSGMIIVHSNALTNEQRDHSLGERIWRLIGRRLPGADSRPGPMASWTPPFRHGGSTRYLATGSIERGDRWSTARPPAQMPGV